MFGEDSKIQNIQIPRYLQETIAKQRQLEDALKKDPENVETEMRLALVWNEVYVDINHALSNDAITEEEAWILRDAYLGIRGNRA